MRNDVTLTLTRRQLAILGAVLGRCIGWDDPRELQRFVSVAGDSVREGWTDAEMDALMEVLAEAANVKALHRAK